MKLLFCRICKDLFALKTGKEQRCACKLSGGRYFEDGLHAEIIGEFAVPVGIDSRDFLHALDNQPDSGKGETFTAFVIPKKCDTIHHR